MFSVSILLSMLTIFYLLHFCNVNYICSCSGVLFLLISFSFFMLLECELSYLLD